MRNEDRNTLIGTEYTRSYTGMRGVAFDGNQVGSEHGRFQYLENMYVDHDSGSTDIESIPGYRFLGSYSKSVNGIFYQTVSKDEGYYLVHAGNNLYRVSSSGLHKTLTGVPIYRKLENAKSSGFSWGDVFYILDGKDIISVDKSGNVTSIQRGTYNPYEPTVAKNGVACGQVNMLSGSCYEEFTLTKDPLSSAASDTLRYKIIDASKRQCAVIGISAYDTQTLFIPSHTEINGIVYEVEEIAEGAFRDMSRLKEIYIAHGIKRISRRAFQNCPHITKVVISNTVLDVGDECFCDSTELMEIYVGKEVRYFGADCFPDTLSNTRVRFSGAQENWDNIVGKDTLNKQSLTTDFSFADKIVCYKMKTLADEILDYTFIGCEPSDFYCDTDENKIYIWYNADDEFGGTKFECQVAVAFSTSYDFAENPDGYFGTEFAVSISHIDAICGCTLCQVFDGRVFLSGNPNLGGTVFYSERFDNIKNVPLCFGHLNMLCDGDKLNPICGMAAVGNTLAVFKETDTNGRNLFFHTKKETLSGVSYPLAYSYKLEGVRGAEGLRDDILFLTDRGIFSFDNGDEKSVIPHCRSTNVNSCLLKEDLSRASLAVWKDYLAVCADGKIYLCDGLDKYKRGNSYEYEWYYLCNIGHYDNDDLIYRYSSKTIGKYTPHENVDDVAKGSIHLLGSSMEDYLTHENGTYYPVYPTYERHGGVFHPATQVFCENGMLFFATDEGDICTFNTDKVGCLPASIMDSDTYTDPDDYVAGMGEQLHPLFHSFGGHAPTYVVKTPFDDCGFPFMRKDMVRPGISMELGNRGYGKVVPGYYTDSEEYREDGEIPISTFNFCEMDFTNLTFDTSEKMTLSLPVIERGWSKIQLCLTSRTFCSPIRVYSMEFRYKIKGKIKN